MVGSGVYGIGQILSVESEPVDSKGVAHLYEIARRAIVA